MYKRELEEYEEAMKTYTLNGGGPAITTNPTIISSPTQSTELSLDFPSDPPQPSPGSMMDEDDKDVPLYNQDIWQQQSDIIQQE